MLHVAPVMVMDIPPTVRPGTLEPQVGNGEEGLSLVPAPRDLTPSRPCRRGHPGTDEDPAVFPPRPPGRSPSAKEASGSSSDHVEQKEFVLEVGGLCLLGPLGPSVWSCRSKPPRVRLHGRGVCPQFRRLEARGPGVVGLAPSKAPWRASGGTAPSLFAGCCWPCPTHRGLLPGPCIPRRVL